jgi:ankyrin repeat protein
MGSSDELFDAIGSGDLAAVRALLAADPALGSARDDEGVSALMRARYRLAEGMVDAVMATEPTLDVFEAATVDDLGRLTELLDADPSLVAAYSPDGFTALHLSAFFGAAEAAVALVERGADVDARGRGWMTGTPLHSAASARHVDVARMLLASGADPNARQSGGWTPLHAAARNGSLELVDLLLEHGADPSTTNDDGAGVVSLAEESGRPGVVARVRSALRR